ncbi:unnamed protein product [Rhizophagus irregularis]|nr:unnamed protein product [Rhizophagus irregularis]
MDIKENEAVHELHDDLDTSDHEETADEEEEVVETTDNKKVKENKNGSFRLSEEHRQIVEQAFNGMKKERMWRLSTEKYVEKELFELGKKLEFEHAVHSFIVMSMT